MSTLDSAQTQAARNLRAVRPAVWPNTNAIINDEQRSAWYALVVAMMAHYTTSSPAQTREFCDIAGVPN